ALFSTTRRKTDPSPPFANDATEFGMTGRGKPRHYGKTQEETKHGSKDPPLRFPGRFGGRACGFAHGAKGRLHPVPGSRKVFGVLVQVHKDALDVEWRATPLAKRRGQRWSARTARRRNLIVQ